VTGDGGARGGLVGFGPTLSAEWMRSRRSASARLPLLGLLVAAMQGLGWFVVATRELTTWRQLVTWQVLYATGLQVPVVALLVGLAVARERDSREGGTRWRPVVVARVLLARWCVTGAQLAALTFAVTVPIIPIGWANGLVGTPGGRILEIFAALSLTSLLPAVLAFASARVTGVVPTVAAAVAWQLAGTLQGESGWWPVQPWTWSVRALLPLLEVHANGLPLEAGSPVAGWSPGPPLLASLAGTVLVAGVLLVLGTGGESRPRERGGRALRLTAGTLALGLRRTAIGPLSVAARALLGATAAGYGAAAVVEVAAGFVVPIGCPLLACLAWGATGPAWRGLALRRDPARLCLRLGALLLGVLTVVVVVTAALAALTGGLEARAVVVLWVNGTAVLLLALWLTVRHGPAVALGAGLVAWLVSLVVTGSPLAEGPVPLWLVGFTSWSLAASTWPRAVTMIGWGAILAASGAVAWLRASRAAAGR
jgi:ABC-2 type transport system permease protein